MDFYDAWNAAVEDIKKQVTGVGVWTALNVAIPITLEDDVFVLGVPEKESDAKGHLQLSNTSRVIQQELGKRIGHPVKVEVIDGITINNWEAVKRRRAETERLSREAAEREKKARKQASNWDNLYDQMARDFGKLNNKGMPQVRARFLRHCVELCVKNMQSGVMDESDERNFARCLERISSYTEVPATFVASMVLEKAAQR